MRKLGLLGLFFTLLTGGAQAAPSHRILVVVSAARAIALRNGVQHPTGHFLIELAVPLLDWTAQGYDYDVASPGGVAPALDPDGDRALYWIGRGGLKQQAQAFFDQSRAFQAPRRLEDLTSADLEGYEGIFIPGGHGPMVDLVNNEALGRVLTWFHQQGRPIGLVCHAPVALLSARTSAGWPFIGYGLTVFSDTEEKFAEAAFLGGKVFFYPESSLRAAGAIIHNAFLPSTSHAFRDRELVTGQNPFSPKAFGGLFLRALRRYEANGPLR